MLWSPYLIRHEETKQNYEQEIESSGTEIYRVWIRQSNCSDFHAIYVPLRGLANIIQPYEDMTNFIGQSIESLSASRSY